MPHPTVAWVGGLTRSGATHSRPQPLIQVQPLPLPCASNWTPVATVCPRTLPVTAQVSSAPPTPHSHVGDTESLPRPSAAQMPPAGELGYPQAQEAPPPRTPRLCHPLSLDRGSVPGHGHPGQHTSACPALSAPEPPLGDSDNCPPGHTSRTWPRPLVMWAELGACLSSGPSVLGPANTCLSQQHPAHCQPPPAGLLCGLGPPTPCTPLPDLGGG